MNAPPAHDAHAGFLSDLARLAFGSLGFLLILT